MLFRGDFAYNKSYSKDYPWGAVKRLNNFDKGVVSNLYICFKPRNVNSDFLECYFETNKWNKEISDIAGEGARNHGLLNMSTIDFFSTKHYIPSMGEQAYISGLINKINERIMTQNKIIDNLKSQIKSISSRVYKLFSKTSKLSELITFEKKTNHKSEEGLKEGRYPFYTNEENQNKFFNSYDFDGLFILSNTGGRANFKIVNGKFAVMSDTLVIKFKNPLLARRYINFLQNNTEKISHDIFAGSGLKHLDKNAFLNMNVPLVDKDLSIINKLFETLDYKLINEKKYLSLLIIQKQYLLNNLFI